MEIFVFIKASATVLKIMILMKPVIWFRHKLNIHTMVWLFNTLKAIVLEIQSQVGVSRETYSLMWKLFSWGGTSTPGNCLPVLNLLKRLYKAHQKTKSVNKEILPLWLNSCIIHLASTDGICIFNFYTCKIKILHNLRFCHVLMILV